MLNRTAWWKYVVAVFALVIGIVYALPNLYENDFGVQIRGARGASPTVAVLQQVQNSLKSQGIEYKTASLGQKEINIRFFDTESQLRAKRIIETQLGRNYPTSLTLLTGTPRWLQDLGALPMYLGLDLRGGVYFLLEVDLDSAEKTAEQRFLDGIKSTLRENNLRNRRPRLDGDGNIILTLRKVEDREKARQVLREGYPELMLSNDENNPQVLTARINKDEIDNIKTFALEQNLTALRERIDQLGVAEPIVQRQGDSRIVVQLPGVQDPARAKSVLSTAATLEFHLVDEDNNALAVVSGQAPPGSRLYKFSDGSPLLLKKKVEYSGVNIVHAAASLSQQNGSPVVSIRLDNPATDVNLRITAENINRRMAVVYQEILTKLKRDDDGNLVLDEKGKPVRESNRIEEVISAPYIRSQLGKSYIIEGMESIDEAEDLALLLRSGALAAPVEIIEERTVGPSLGQANIDKGFRSVTIGFIAVLLFMIVYYRLFGIVATVALTINLSLIISVLSIFQATLTLPGMAGVVLTVGMAVDANVLIFERIREEINNGNSPQASIHRGYDSALSTIVDANITTLIAAIVLFYFGTGPIKGFSVTLGIGILTSMFSAIMLTRIMVNWVYGGRTVKKLSI